ncbi:MAG: FAD-dependent oxidoreductase [Streptosporangiales bacterium]|nr:FAD-dependent oxidoreductase [Streptosporangiales bacterium]
MSTRVVVIGAGVVGSALAAELGRLGAGVTLIDSGRPAGGTSNATFSWTNANSKEPREYHDLNVGGMLAHRRLAAELPAASWYHAGGNLEWTDTAAGEAALHAKVDRLRRYHYPVALLDRAQALTLEPSLAADQLSDDGIAYYPEEGWIEPTRLVGTLLDLARARGARVVTNDAVTGCTFDGAAVAGVTTASGASFAADQVVDCAGPEAAAVAALAGLELPMRNTQGVLTYVEPVAVAVGRVIHGPRVQLRPDGGGRLLLHSEAADGAARQRPDGGWDVAPGTAERLLADAAELYPAIDGAAVESVRVGTRPMPADGLPVLGRSAGIENFHFAVTHSAATLCLRIAELLGPEIVGGAASPELAPFRHDRLG